MKTDATLYSVNRTSRVTTNKGETKMDKAKTIGNMCDEKKARDAIVNADIREKLVAIKQGRVGKTGRVGWIPADTHEIVSESTITLAQSL